MDNSHKRRAGARRLACAGIAFLIAPVLAGETGAPAPAGTPGAHAQQTAAPRGIPLGVGLELAQAALASCAARGYAVAVTIADSAGAPRLLLAQDGARQQAVDSSTAKAYTVIRFQQASGVTAQKAAADPALAAEIAADPKLRARAGGVPIVAGGAIIGAVGVGGAPGGEKDEACALEGIARVNERLN